MTDTTDALRALLERAVALDEAMEAKSAPAVEAEPEAGVLPPGAEPVADDEDGAAELIAELGDRITSLEERIYSADETPAEPAGDPAEEKGFDFDEEFDDPDLATPGLVETKAFKACGKCGSTKRDEFADGTAACEECGTALEEKADDGELEQKAAADDTSELEAWAADFVAQHEVKADPADDGGELDLAALQARRAALG